MLQSNVLVYEVVLRNILWIYRACHNQLSSQCSSQDHLHQVNKILLGFEAANKLGVVWCAVKRNSNKMIFVIIIVDGLHSHIPSYYFSCI